jgi:phage FluMu gp28-like protein
VELQTLKADFAAEFIDLELATQTDKAAWEPYQISFLNNSKRFGLDVKARQVGWSFTAALDAVVDGILESGTPHIFVSVNLDEAKEKIRYAKSIIDAIRPDVRPALIRASQTELEFNNGSRLISHPCRPPRGKARSRIYLDEMGHYKEFLCREIYRGALPATIKGDGYIRIGSSPLGASGLYWEIATERLRQYPGYADNRRVVPWWQVGALCKDTRAAKLVAPQMITEERVYALGTPALIEIFENMFLEDFQQEYECSWIDEATAWITWDIIKRNQDPTLLWWHAKGVDETLHMAMDVRRAIDAGEIEAVLAGGIDVGRHRHLTEFVALGKSTTGQLPTRFSISLDRVEYDDQERCFREVITSLPFTQVLIDQNGLGGQLAENLEQTGKVKGVDFTNPSKELWAVEARIQAERGNVPLPMDRDVAYQIHSIKKTVTAAKHNVFDTDRNEKHHADKFWAWALAICASGVSGGPPAGETVNIPVGEYYDTRRKKSGGLWKRGH